MNDQEFERKEKARQDAMFDAQFADEPTSDVEYADEPPCKTGSQCTNKCQRCGEINPAEIHTCTPKPEPAECDGGQCGIGGYCKDCPKTKPELKIINMKNFVGSGKPLVPVCWMNANDIDKTDWKVWAHGKPTISMPLFASPPQREWQGLTDEEAEHIYAEYWNDVAMFIEAIEAKLKEKNT